MQNAHIPVYQHPPSSFQAGHKPKQIRSSESHRLLDLRNRLPGIQPLRARPRAVENRMAPVQTHAVIQHLFPLGFVLVA